MTDHYGDSDSTDAPVESGGSSVQLMAELAEFFEKYDAATTEAERVELRKRWKSQRPGVLLVRPVA